MRPNPLVPSSQYLVPALKTSHRSLTENSINAEALPLAYAVNAEVISRSSRCNHIEHIRRIPDRGLVDVGDDIADFEAGLVTRSVFINAGNQHALDFQADALQGL